ATASAAIPTPMPKFLPAPDFFAVLVLTLLPAPAAVVAPAAARVPVTAGASGPVPGCAVTAGRSVVGFGAAPNIAVAAVGEGSGAMTLFGIALGCGGRLPNRTADTASANSLPPA